MESLNFFIIHLAFLIIAEFIWEFFTSFISLKILRKNEILFTKKFYIFVITAAISSVLINRIFEYGVQDAPIISEIWGKLGGLERAGVILVPTLFLIYIYFYLASSILKLGARETLFVAILVGLATSPWRMLL